MKIQPFLLPLLFLFFAATANAQFSFGIKTSINKSGYSTGLNLFSKDNTSKLNDFGTSVQLYYRTSKHFSFGIEPGLVQRSAIDPLSSLDFGFCGNGIDFTQFPHNSASVYANYIQLPILAKYNVSLVRGKLALFAKSGFGLSYATSGYQQSTYINRTGSDITPINFDNNDGFRRWDSGIFSGIGIGWRFPFGTITVEAESYQGFMSAYRFLEMKNQSYGYSLGYQLDL